MTCLLVLAASTVFVSPSRSAADTLDPPPVHVNLFGTVGAAIIDDERGNTLAAMPYNNFEEDPNVDELTRLGIQGSAQLGDESRLTFQAVSRGALDYEPMLEWAYFSHNLSPELQLRIGRFRRPLFQYAEEKNVGYAYVWTRPPVLSYFNFEAFYTPVDGIDVIHRGSARRFDYQVEGYLGIGKRGRFPLSNTDVGFISQLSGGVSLGVDVGRFRVQTSVSMADLDVDLPGIEEAADVLWLLQEPELADLTDLKDNYQYFTSVATSYSLQQWELIAEVTRWSGDSDAIWNTHGGHLSLLRNFRGGFTLGYTMGRQYGKPAIDLLAKIRAASSAATDPMTSTGLETLANELQPFFDELSYRRSTHTLGLRYDFHPNAALKLEIERMEDHRFDESFNSGAISIDFVY